MLAAVLDDLIEANHRYAASFDGQGMAAPPTRRLAVLTCMDSRIDPAAILGFTTGEANVVRNAGGRVTSDALRSLALGTGLFGLESVVVMHHTDCALAGRERGVRASTAQGRGPHRVRGLAVHGHARPGHRSS